MPKKKPAPKKETWDERKAREREAMTFAERVKTIAIDRTSLKPKN